MKRTEYTDLVTADLVEKLFTNPEIPNFYLGFFGAACGICQYVVLTAWSRSGSGVAHPWAGGNSAPVSPHEHGRHLRHSLLAGRRHY